MTRFSSYVEGGRVYLHDKKNFETAMYNIDGRFERLVECLNGVRMTDVYPLSLLNRRTAQGQSLLEVSVAGYKYAFREDAVQVHQRIMKDPKRLSVLPGLDYLYQGGIKVGAQVFTQQIYLFATERDALVNLSKYRSKIVYESPLPA